MQHESIHSPLISSSDVTGTDVYNYDGEHIGAIDHLTIDKKSGKISYAVMGFGGFLGLGEDHHPIPWASLKYDEEKGGYVTNITKQQLETRPRHKESWFNDRTWEEEAHRHYGVTPYWF